MRTKNLSFQDALNTVAAKFIDYAKEYLAITKQLLLDSDPSLKEYVYGIGYWITATHEGA